MTVPLPHFKITETIVSRTIKFTLSTTVSSKIMTEILLKKVTNFVPKICSMGFDKHLT
jgi:hypothetical protein